MDVKQQHKQASAQIYLARSFILELAGDVDDADDSSIDTTQGSYALTVDDLNFAPGYECVNRYCTSGSLPFFYQVLSTRRVGGSLAFECSRDLCQIERPSLCGGDPPTSLRSAVVPTVVERKRIGKN